MKYVRTLDGQVLVIERGPGGVPTKQVTEQWQSVSDADAAAWAAIGAQLDVKVIVALTEGGDPTDPGDPDDDGGTLATRGWFRDAVADLVVETATAPTAEQMALVDQNPATPFRVQQDARLADTIATAVDEVGVEKRAPGGALTTGNVMLFGDHAYAPTGIATAAVFGGAVNNENVIGGNTANVNTATSNLTGAPALTGENGNWTFIHGGYDNAVNGWACSVMGFHCKVAAGANHGTIAGGSLHTVAGPHAYWTISGGTGHTITGDRATIGGGAGHTAASQATVSGGNGNAAPGSNSTVGGGNANSSGGNNSAVGGGTNNSAPGTSSTIPGGQFNTTTGTASYAIGRENTAAGPASGAIGRDAVAPANLDHALAHGAGKFTTAGDAQVLRLVAKRQTTDATPTGLRLDAAGTVIPLTVPADTCWAFRVMVAARNTGANENAAYEIKGAIRRDTASASTTALVGTPVVTVLGEDAAAAAWDVVATASTSLGALEITVTGEAAKTIRWVANIELVNVSG